MLKAELAAPAGNTEKLEFALAFGADAVYAGQPRFSLRARDNGFKTLDDIRLGIEKTHRLNKRFFLTANIFPHNHKIDSFKNSLFRYIELGPDAIILSDPGIIRYVTKHFPKQAVHLSVQANCTNWETAAFWQDLGVSRIILSRELNLEEICLIRQKVPELELEVFVHGAVCVAYSGRCLISQYQNRRDSNQGLCSNACRYRYRLYQNSKTQRRQNREQGTQYYLQESGQGESELMPLDEDEHGTYILNSKDICAIEILDRLTEAGVTSFKIEGRTKSLYYLARAVRSYRRAIDDLGEGRPFNVENLRDLYKLDSRGYFPGFFVPVKESPQNYESTRVRSESGQVAAVVRGYHSPSALACISVKGSIRAGDSLEALTPENTFSFKARNLINSKGAAVDRLHAGQENCRLEISRDPGRFCLIVRNVGMENRCQL